MPCGAGIEGPPSVDEQGGGEQGLQSFGPERTAVRSATGFGTLLVCGTGVPGRSHARTPPRQRWQPVLLRSDSCTQGRPARLDTPVPGSAPLACLASFRLGSRPKDLEPVTAVEATIVIAGFFNTGVLVLWLTVHLVSYGSIEYLQQTFHRRTLR